MRWGWRAAALGAMLVAALWPVTSRYGVNYRWGVQRMPLYEKAINFTSRHLQARRLVRELTEGLTDDEKRLRLVFTWTVERVQPVPPGLPIIDDHPLYILVRGYGAPDQRAWAFALLASYAGYPATVVRLRSQEPDRTVFVTLVRSRDQRRIFVFDVNHALALQDQEGRLMDLSAWLTAPHAASAIAGDSDASYAALLRTIRVDHITFSRMDAQHLMPRLWVELGRWLGRPVNGR